MFFFGATRPIPAESAKGVATAVIVAFDGVVDISHAESIEGVADGLEAITVHGNNSFLDYTDIVSWNREEVKSDFIC